VSKFKVGEIAGVGCFVDSCRTCKSCKAGDEQLCDEGMTGDLYVAMKEGQRFQLTVATPQVLPLMKSILYIFQIN
jgi:D-arabinose 1-dehydrogenase-like Zn-dependent alcohol dehydrogenase